MSQVEDIPDGGGEMTAGGDDEPADGRRPQPYQPAVISRVEHRVSQISLFVSSYLCLCVCVCICTCLSVCICLSGSLCVHDCFSLCCVISRKLG